MEPGSQEMLTPSERSSLMDKLGHVLRPSRPIDEERLLAGRVDQLDSLVSVARRIGFHAVVYGERGVGKTSLAATAQSILTSERLTVRVNTDPTSTFSSLWSAIAAEVEISYLSSGQERVDDHLVQAVQALRVVGESPSAALGALRILSARRPTFLVIDEFDKAQDDELREQMANLIKALADKAVPCTLTLVGVSDTVGELIGEHESIRRNLRQIHMPRMNREELRDVLTTAERELSIKYPG